MRMSKRQRQDAKVMADSVFKQKLVSLLNEHYADAIGAVEPNALYGTASYAREIIDEWEAIEAMKPDGPAA